MRWSLHTIMAAPRDMHYQDVSSAEIEVLPLAWTNKALLESHEPVPVSSIMKISVEQIWLRRKIY